MKIYSLYLRLNRVWKTSRVRAETSKTHLQYFCTRMVLEDSEQPAYPGDSLMALFIRIRLSSSMSVNKILILLCS